ncbi:hypothetical protein KQI69_02165, partial [Eubacterium sp. MSJ-13]|uniref:hypothetical protein n=1 Tax=Eubacterium sp. MSJ-13 TaxID=2841513 RepID=UPI001C0FCBFA
MADIDSIGASISNDMLKEKEEENDCKIIKVIQGEEYQEKLETVIEENNFFYDAYNEANDILISIPPPSTGGTNSNES